VAICGIGCTKHDIVCRSPSPYRGHFCVCPPAVRQDVTRVEWFASLRKKLYNNVKIRTADHYSFCCLKEIKKIRHDINILCILELLRSFILYHCRTHTTIQLHYPKQAIVLMGPFSTEPIRTYTPAFVFCAPVLWIVTHKITSILHVASSASSSPSLISLVVSVDVKQHVYLLKSIEIILISFSFRVNHVSNNLVPLTVKPVNCDCPNAVLRSELVHKILLCFGPSQWLFWVPKTLRKINIETEAPPTRQNRRSRNGSWWEPLFKRWLYSMGLGVSV